jgi:flagellar assembly protein FliH
MSTLFNGGPAPAGAEVESFIYQDTDGNSLGSESAGSLDPPKDKAPAKDSVARISEHEIPRLVAEARAEGIREGERRARAASEEALAREKARIAEVLSNFQQERNEYYSKVEVELVHFALAIAAKVLHREAQVDRMVVAGLVKVMLEKLEQGSGATVRVHPEAAESWRHYFHDNAALRIVEDFSLGPKDCRLETQMGTADLGLDAQLKEIEKGFFDLLAQRPGPK